MSRSVNVGAVRTLAKPLQLDGIRAGKANLRIDANPATKQAVFGTFRAVVREAMRRDELSQKAFAIDCKQSESVVSEALSGTRNLAAEWVWQQTSRTFHMHLLGVWREAMNLDEQAEDDAEDRQLMEFFVKCVLSRTKARRTA
jgi:hypothetical protein